MTLLKAGAWLAVALFLAPARDACAQSQAQASPATQTETQAQAQAGQATPPQAQAKPPDPKAAKAGRQSQRKGRKPRTPARQPATPDRGAFAETRTSREAGPTRQTLAITTNVLGGYDDNLTAGSGTGSNVSPAAMASGSTGSLDSTLDYFRGNTRRSLQVGSTGNILAYPGYIKGVVAGGSASVGASATLGRDQTVRVSERVGYEPFFSVFSPGASIAPQPPPVGGTVAATGLFERRSVSTNSSVSLDSRWSPRNWTTFSASYGLQRFSADDFGDSATWSAQAGYRRGLTPGTRAHVDYRYTETRYTSSAYGVLPTHEQRIEGGPEVQKTLSRSRRLSLSLGVGAAYFESVDQVTRAPYHAWVPVGSASATLGFSSWSVGGGYNREFSRLRGLTDEVYRTDTAYVTTGGGVAPRTTLRVNGSYSNWRTPLASGKNDRLNVYGASLQVRVAVSAKVSATADYSYYHQFYSNPGDLPEGFPAKYNRQAVHVGLTLWVPLAGAPPPPAPR